MFNSASNSYPDKVYVNIIWDIFNHMLVHATDMRYETNLEMFLCMRQKQNKTKKLGRNKGFHSVD